MTTEEWRPVVGYEGLYEVSDHGRVRSWHGWRGKRAAEPRILSLPQDGTGYVRLILCGPGGNREHVRLHVLVAATFIGPRPDGLDIRHLDGDRTNNAAANLAYGTRSENIQDAVEHGTHNQVAKDACKWGHPFTPDNTAIRRDRYQRICLTCARRSYREYHARRKVAS